MTLNDFEEQKKKILHELVVSEDETLDNLKKLVSKSKHFFFIEGATGRVVLSRDFDFSNTEKIMFLLMGKYFASNLEIIPRKPLDIRQISEELGGIPITTLSAPLGKLVSDNLVNKPEKGKYGIAYHAIETFLDDMWKKYKPKVDAENET